MEVARRVPRSAVDGALAALAFVAMAVAGAHDARALGLSALIAGGLALRRRFPLAAYLVGTAALEVEGLWGPDNPASPYVNLLALYSLGEYGTPRRALVGPVVVLPGVLAYVSAQDASAVTAAGTVFVWLLVWALGYAGARRRDRQEAERVLLRRAVAADERARMARELHDLVGHTVNVMLVQAGASRLVLDSDPDQARELLSSVERTGREALDELDRVLATLRPDGPRPGLDRLVRRMAEVGMDVALRVDAELPSAVELVVYRIVQEALTNALTHGRADSASVTVLTEEGEAVLEVRDDGCGPPIGYRPGRGLAGIAERAAALGGTAEHGGGDGGGFRLRVLLPLP
ncbi:sensor histidine kinase [Actinokineospora sp. NBRC 105648]|uniref:sensor histidine kinase n=1 Tax=Actinokineospora sp. NBRC 105648 TaxID=3032206 RepID=UPI0024A13F42|nr:sensor histidine kinase [Actinokineospora sp. NBRC 105648]GLZ42975.1 two-component sensor histidine kinase [Actinokineospora sp. NBRC 105648]